MGRNVGVNVGAADGAVDGGPDGAADGAVEGNAVGKGDGVNVGAADGVAVGANDGAADGAPVGANVGPHEIMGLEHVSSSVVSSIVDVGVNNSRMSPPTSSRYGKSDVLTPPGYCSVRESCVLPAGGSRSSTSNPV